jgi:hypothetical protein
MLAKQQDQIQYAHLLRELRVGWTPDLRREYFEWFLMANSDYNGGNTFKTALSSMRTDAIAALSDADRAPIQEVLDRPYVVVGGRGGGGGGGAAGRGGAGQAAPAGAGRGGQ